MNQSIEISTDKQRLDIGLIHRVLGQTYWAEGIPLDVVERSIKHSLCFGVYAGEQQLGFARVITDYTTFAYLSDVFIVPERQGEGLAKQLVTAIRAHERLQGLRRWHLITLDAQGLYSQFGFQAVAHADQHMEIRVADIYRKAQTAT